MGSLLICEALLVLYGVLVIILVLSTGMTFRLRIGTGLAVRLGRVEGLLDWQFELEEEDCFWDTRSKHTC